jgi:serine/threonine-protein kinase
LSDAYASGLAAPVMARSPDRGKTSLFLTFRHIVLVSRPRIALGPVLCGQPEPVAAELRTATIGTWQTGRILNEGPLADVLEARPAGADDAPWTYVVKRLHTHWQDEPRALEMLSREAFVGSQVRNCHLVTVLDAQLLEPPYYIVQPRLVGTPVSKLIAAGRMDVAESLWVARQVAEALDAMHRQGWIHGDVKPQNILVGPEGHATLIDLGFARRVGETGSAADRWVAGTWNYIAPETISSAGGCDPRSDLYSLGATLYEMLAGRPPFAGQSLAEVAAAHRQTTPRPLDELVPDLPPQAVSLVHQLLAKHPLRRPACATGVVRRLVALEIATLGSTVRN